MVLPAPIPRRRISKIKLALFAFLCSAPLVIFRSPISSWVLNLSTKLGKTLGITTEEDPRKQRTATKAQKLQMELLLLKRSRQRVLPQLLAEAAYDAKLSIRQTQTPSAENEKAHNRVEMPVESLPPVNIVVWPTTGWHSTITDFIDRTDIFPSMTQMGSCSTRCQVTENATSWKTADALLLHGPSLRAHDMPPFKPAGQLWLLGEWARI
jgi:hypothetical protein